MCPQAKDGDIFMNIRGCLSASVSVCEDWGVREPKCSSKKEVKASEQVPGIKKREARIRIGEAE